MTQIEMILDKISTLEDRVKKLEGRDDDMMVFENKSFVRKQWEMAQLKMSTGFEEEVTDGELGYSKYELKAAVMVGQNANEIQAKYPVGPETATELGTIMAKKEVEWNMSAAEGEDYDYWFKVYEKLQG